MQLNRKLLTWDLVASLGKLPKLLGCELLQVFGVDYFLKTFDEGVGLLSHLTHNYVEDLLLSESNKILKVVLGDWNLGSSRQKLYFLPNFQHLVTFGCLFFMPFFLLNELSLIEDVLLARYFVLPLFFHGILRDKFFVLIDKGLAEKGVIFIFPHLFNIFHDLPLIELGLDVLYCYLLPKNHLVDKYAETWAQEELFPDYGKGKQLANKLEKLQMPGVYPRLSTEIIKISWSFYKESIVEVDHTLGD